jgi:hypothetical protein
MGCEFISLKVFSQLTGSLTKRTALIGHGALKKASVTMLRWFEEQLRRFWLRQNDGRNRMTTGDQNDDRK